MSKDTVELTVLIIAPHINNEGLSTNAEEYVKNDVLTRFPPSWSIEIKSCSSTREE